MPLNLRRLFNYSCILLLAGCGKDTPQTEGRSGEALLAETPAAYPQDSFLRLGVVRGRIESDRRYLFRAPEAGQLTLQLEESPQALQKGALWAVLMPEQLELERAVIQRRAEVLEQRRSLFEQVELPKSRLQAEQELADAERQLAMIEAVQGVAEEPDVLEDLIPGFDWTDITVSTERLREQVALLKRRAEMLGAERELPLAEIKLAELELEQNRAEFELRKKQFEMRMPFDGRLDCNIDLDSNPREIFVTQGQLIGVAEDPQAISVKVELRDAVWLGYDPDALKLIGRFSGVEKVGEFARSSIRSQGGLSLRSYHFVFEAAVTASLQQRRNTNMTADLALALGANYYIVPKLDLIRAHPELFGRGQWRDGIAAVWQDAEVMAVGSTELAILWEPSK